MHCLVNVRHCLKHTSLVLSWPCKLEIAGHHPEQQAVMCAKLVSQAEGQKLVM